jgi:hypothetical protein
MFADLFWRKSFVIERNDRMSLTRSKTFSTAIIKRDSQARMLLGPRADYRQHTGNTSSGPPTSHFISLPMAALHKYIGLDAWPLVLALYSLPPEIRYVAVSCLVCHKISIPYELTRYNESTTPHAVSRTQALSTCVGDIATSLYKGSSLRSSNGL